MARIINHIVRRWQLPADDHSPLSNPNETTSESEIAIVSSEVPVATDVVREPEREATAATPSGVPRPPLAGLNAMSTSSSCVVDEDIPPRSSSLSSCQHRHRRRHSRAAGGSSSRRHRRSCRIKWKEVNFMAAMSSVIAAVLVCTSLAEPHWWYVSGGKCRDFQQTVYYIGVRSFLFDGHFESALQDGRSSSIYYFGNSPANVLIDCLSQTTVQMIQAIVGLCFLVILINITAVVVEVITFTNCTMKAIRRTALFPILSVILCVTINGLSYLVTQQLSLYYESNPLHGDSKIDVEFSLSFYTIMAAGVMSVFAVAFSLLCRRMHLGGSAAVAPRWPPSVTSADGGRLCRDDRLLIGADYNQFDRTGSCTSLPALPPPYEP